MPDIFFLVEERSDEASEAWAGVPASASVASRGWGPVQSQLHSDIFLVVVMFVVFIYFRSCSIGKGLVRFVVVVTFGHVQTSMSVIFIWSYYLASLNSSN